MGQCLASLCTCTRSLLKGVPIRFLTRVLRRLLTRLLPAGVCIALKAGLTSVAVLACNRMRPDNVVCHINSRVNCSAVTLQM